MDSSLFTTSLSLAELSILNEIQRMLTPDIQDVRARLYKLNVYGPGGFFKAHRDTPRAAQMFGTLVNLDELEHASSVKANAKGSTKSTHSVAPAGQHASESKQAESTPAMTTSLAEKLQEALRDPEFAPNGVKLGFALCHGYIIGKNGKVPVLKGSDHLLKDDLDDLVSKSRKRTYWGLDVQDEAKLQQLKEWEFEDMVVPERDGVW
ncbi:hypothetical protein Poli38472_004874 [Pythium oligandrum]|uniref:Uncharacterized protein n=1 Tax=Pythium oligandrum TaxID=41045 RepID=A0A8K1FDU8_PYTOL|nr:hypothetical protein Poli38472_004874 [Pythium oligandrum]|eukprot:TMW59805.1 hypothetical protein Poli38472_004874 [Pythium oligandrum]